MTFAHTDNTPHTNTPNTNTLPTKHTMHFALAFSLLLTLTAIGHALDLLQLVVVGTGNQSGTALAEAAKDHTLMDQFVSAEGPSYKLVSPGESLPVDRNLLPSSEDEHRKLTDLGCPNSCSNSGSTKCRILGCAYCGKCGGRRDRRGLRSVEFKSADEQRQIENNLEAKLAQYCKGKVGCTLHARIMRTRSDGTASLAT
jgi:hypothetical protein